MRFFALLVVPALAALTSFPQREEPIDLVAEGPRSVLRFAITDGEGGPLTARLTFLGTGGPAAQLFSRTDAAPLELAVRNNVVYTRSGRGAITVPPGRYTIVASRGLEWDLAVQTLALEEGREARFEARLAHEVDASGWVSGDFHLHTLTYSGHGDANLEERILSLVGEGVEFAVATDHNHNTDYRPTIGELSLSAAITPVTGNEISTPIGHMNAFPLDPARPPVDATLADANELFRLIRGEPNAFGVTPLIQLNHPRWDGIDYFGQTGLDPATGTSAERAYSPDFDALEILNENAGWGYFGPSDEVEVGANHHSVLQDWFHLLNRGARYAAVGNSDSHTVHYAFAGYPRNFVRVEADEPGTIDPAEVARAVRAKALFTTLGPFVEFTVDDTPLGGDATAHDGHARLSLVVQAASWIDCDVVKVVANGDVVERIPIPPSTRPTRLEHQLELCLRRPCDRHGSALPGSSYEDRDAWVVLLVEGDRSLAPIVHDETRAALPLAVTNPIWIDGNGDGRFTSLWERSRALAASGDALRFSQAFAGSAAERSFLLLAFAEGGSSFEEDFDLSAILDGLSDENRSVQLSALRASEWTPNPILVTPLRGLFTQTGDAYLALAALRALSACGERDLVSLWGTLFDRFSLESLRHDAEELLAFSPGGPVRDWEVAGPFAGALPAEYALALAETTVWTASSASPDLTLDLASLGPVPPIPSGSPVHAYARSALWSKEARPVRALLGTSDGCRVFLNGELVYENLEPKGIDPLEHQALFELESGWNELLFAVEDRGGDFGLSCRILDEDVRPAARPD